MKKRVKIEVGKIYGGRQVLALSSGYRGNEIMVKYKYDTEPEDIEPLFCLLSTFLKRLKDKYYQEYYE